MIHFFRSPGVETRRPQKDFFQRNHNYLKNSAIKISKNVNDSKRKNPISIISTISSGYDSAVATVIAKHMGAEKAVTITQANSWLNRSDSGEKVAAALGIKCECYNIKQQNYSAEETLWAAIGHAEDLNMTIFNFPKPVCLMMTAFHGDLIWEEDHYNISEFLVRHDTSGVGFTEFALQRGVIHCSIAFWGIQNAHEIQKIWCLDEMRPWTLHADYDRPVPRRIVEGDGVPREIYAKKKTTSGIGNWSPNPLPFSRDLKKDYIRYLKSKGLKTPFKYESLFWQLIIAVDYHILEPVRNFLKFEEFPRLPFHQPRIKRWRLFIWANEKVKLKYQSAVKRIKQKNDSL